MTTAIDVARRFPTITLAEAWERASQTERWVFDEVISSSITTIYGPSNVGKSYLISSMLLSLMIEDREFLAMRPTDPGKQWWPVILCTDPGSPEEYGDRIYRARPEGVTLDIPLIHIGMTRTPEEWEALADHLLDTDRNFVVLDNLNGATGDPNDTPAATIVYDGLNRLAARGIPCVVVHHETEKYRTPRGAPPMGTGVPVQKSRAWIQVRQTGRRKLRGGNTGLYIQGNGLSQHAEVIAQPLAGPAYRVITHGPVTDESAEEVKPSRSTTTLDQSAAMANFVVEHCPRMSGRGAAKALAANFPVTESTAQTWMRSGEKVGKLLQKSPSGEWERVA